MKLLLVGSGLTSAVLSSILREQLKGRATLECWDKARGVGGRLSTSRLPEDQSCTVDLGAQYFSLLPEYTTKHLSFHDELISTNVLRPITSAIEGEQPRTVNTGEKIRNFCAPAGASSIVKYWFQKSGVDIKCNRTVDRLDIIDNNQWRVSTQSGVSDMFDGVILTMPTPQILALRGGIAEVIGRDTIVKTRMENVSYTSRFALGLFYKSNLDVAWTVRYVYDDPCVRFIAVDTKKRGIETGPSSVVVHTSVPFGLEHLEEDKEKVGQLVLEHLRMVAPELPEPDHIKYHKWRYSQVQRAYEDRPGCVLLNRSPLVLITGDGFIASGLDGCIEAASSSARMIIDSLTSLK